MTQPLLPIVRQAIALYCCCSILGGTPKRFRMEQFRGHHHGRDCAYFSSSGRNKKNYEEPKDSSSMRRQSKFMVALLLLVMGAFVYVRLLHTPEVALVDNTMHILPCRYHGNCPIGTACTAHHQCQEYSSCSRNHLWNTTTKEKRHELCVETCLKELTIEEGFQFGSIPIVRSTYPAQLGCVVEFQRQRRHGKWTDRPSMDYRIAQRWRSLVRIDPILGEMDKAQTASGWMVLCRHTCKTNADCPAKLKCLGRQAHDHKSSVFNGTFDQTCQLANPQQKDMVIISGADSGYFDALENLAASLRYWSPSRRLVVYNLGMTLEELSRVESWPNVLGIHWKHGFPGHFPPHVTTNLHNYAWKSLAVNASVHEYKSILWLDAGVTIVSPVEPIEEIIQLHGLFLVRGQDEHMKSISHPATYRWFGYDKETYAAGPHYAGGIQGHVYPSRYIDSIVIRNAQCAMDPACIAPPQAYVGNHRFDQTSLSILAYQEHVQAYSYTEFLAGSFEQLHTQSLSVASTPYILWTARGTCDYYAENHGFTQGRKGNQYE